MNEENGKHEFNFFLDKQLQQKLLEANEEILEKEFTGSLFQNSGQQSTHSISTNKNNVNIGAQQSHKLPKYLDCVHVCGWCPNPNTVYRKSEIDAPPRSRGHHLAITRESLFSRDSKSRPQNIDNFIFRHYSDPRKYIEQYRKEHACYDSTNFSATKTEFLETRRFYAYNQYSPLAVGINSNSGLHQPNSYVPQPQLEPPVQNNETNSKPHHQQTPSLQYTNRREQKRNTIGAKNQHQYKLTKTPPNSNKPDHRVSDYAEEYIESLEVVKKQRHSGSAKERPSSMVNGLGIHKSATKINVPSANFGGKTLRTANTGISSDNSLPSHFPGHKTGQTTTGRMLDTLACVAGTSSGADKQDSGVTPSLDGPSKETILESLRSINQRPPKSTPRPLHLTYYTGDAITSNAGNGRRHSDCGYGPTGSQPFHLPHQNQHCRHRHHHLQNSSTNSSDNNRCEDGISSTNDENGEEIRHRFANSSNNYKTIDSTIDKNVNKWRGCDAGDDVTVLSNASSTRKLYKGDNRVRNEIIFLSKKEGAEILSSANDVDLNEDPDFLSAISDWKRIFSEHKDKDTACLIREARNKEFKHLIAKTFDQKSSLSHQRRIKHLIEQSRLKTQFDINEPARVHCKADVGHQPVRRFIDIKTGISPSDSGYLKSSNGHRYLARDGNSVEHKFSYGEKLLKKKKSKLKKCLPPATRYFPSRREYLENQNYNNSLCKSPDSDTAKGDNSPGCINGGRGRYSYNESKTFGENESSRNWTDKIHVVPCGIEPDPEDAIVRGLGEVNAEERHDTEVKDVERRCSIIDKDRSNACDEMGNDGERRYPVMSSVSQFEDCCRTTDYTTSKPSRSSHNDGWDNAGDGDSRYQLSTVAIVAGPIPRDNDVMLCHKYLPRDNLSIPPQRKSVTNNPPRPARVTEKRSHVHCSNGESGERKDEGPCIPLVCGTAIGENNALKSTLSKSRSCNVSSASASSKQNMLSPLSETDIQLLAANMAVKINMTKLKVTHSGDVERSHSMLL